MKMEEFYYKSADGKTEIHAVKWLPETDPIAILQIAHGVTEYIERYENLAKYFTEKGFIVCGNDHIGHGKSIAKEAKPMYFGPKGSWNFAVKDINECQKIISSEYSQLPYFMLGFSLGSFLLRTYLIDYDTNIDMAIIMGTGTVPKIQIKLAQMIVNNEAKKVGEDNTSPLIQKLTFETYNKSFEPNRTKYDWLCSNNESLDEYISDPMRGEDFSAGLFRELLEGMDYTNTYSNIKKMNKDIPILFMSGDKDPVGNQSKGVIQAYNKFKKFGIKSVDIKLYKDLRHDILHEKCKDDIYNDIYNFLAKKLEKNAK